MVDDRLVTMQVGYGYRRPEMTKGLQLIYQCQITSCGTLPVKNDSKAWESLSTAAQIAVC